MGKKTKRTRIQQKYKKKNAKGRGLALLEWNKGGKIGGVRREQTTVNAWWKTEKKQEKNRGGRGKVWTLCGQV